MWLFTEPTCTACSLNLACACSFALRHAHTAHAVLLAPAGRHAAPGIIGHLSVPKHVPAPALMCNLGGQES
jgi:hypothetical protein